MVESTLRVEIDSVSTNPFFGRVVRHKVINETHRKDYDNSPSIAPNGVHVYLTTKDLRTFDIKVSRTYFDCESSADGGGRYLTFFEDEERVYELCVQFKENKCIDWVTLSEWLHCGEFEDGNDSDNVYWSDDFAVIETFES